ncbi:hypothetical protein Hanom_Chr17g01577951 [Helianthus anomalus]
MGKPSPPVGLEPRMNPEPSLHPDVSPYSSQGSNQRLQWRQPANPPTELDIIDKETHY